MKILLLSEVFPPQTGGSGRWLWEIYRRFPTSQVVIVAGENPRQSDFDASHKLDVCRTVLNLPEWGLLSRRGLSDYIRLFRTVRKIVVDREVTVIHCGRCLPEGLVAASLRLTTGIPYTCYVHGEDVSTARTSREHSLLIKAVFKGSKSVIANSQNTADLLLTDWGVPESRVQVLHPGVDTTYFVPAPMSRAAREELGWASHRVVLTVGRLQMRKGHDMMIQAMPEILNRVPDALYCIVGDGAERPRLEHLAKEVGVVERVQFKGEVSDASLLQCYQQCDLFILPNREVDGDIEGFGMVLLEAQAAAKAVLAGDSGGTAETMKIPATGRVIDCRSPGLIAESVSELLINDALRIQIGHAARQWVEERFDWTALSRHAGRYFGLDAEESQSKRPLDPKP